MREIALIIHFIGLVMAVGSGFAQMFLGIASRGIKNSENNNLMINNMALGKMGNIGLIILILSGGYLMTPYWAVLDSYPILILKLLLVVVVVILVVIMNIVGKKAIANKETNNSILKILGMISLPLSILIIIFAVMMFK